MKAVILSSFIFFIKVVCCQEEDLIKCSANFYRNTDSVCFPCVDDICKTVFEKKDTEYEDCRNYCSKKIQYPCYNMGKDCPDNNKKYDDCLKHFSSNMEYLCYNVSKKSADSPQSNKWFGFLTPESLIVVISVIIGVLMGFIVKMIIVKFCSNKRIKQTRDATNETSYMPLPKNELIYKGLLANLMSVDTPHSDERTNDTPQPRDLNITHPILMNDTTRSDERTTDTTQPGSSNITDPILMNDTTRSDERSNDTTQPGSSNITDHIPDVQVQSLIAGNNSRKNSASF